MMLIIALMVAQRLCCCPEELWTASSDVWDSQMLHRCLINVTCAGGLFFIIRFIAIQKEIAP